MTMGLVTVSEVTKDVYEVVGLRPVMPSPVRSSAEVVPFQSALVPSILTYSGAVLPVFSQVVVTLVVLLKTASMSNTNMGST